MARARCWAKMPGDLWQKFANLRLLLSYLWTHPGKKLLFMGGDFGQWNEWNYEESLQWHLLQWSSHQGLQKCVADLNRLYRREPALHQVDFDPPGFEWIDCHNFNDSVLIYMRRAKNPDDFLVVACNFTPVPRGHIASACRRAAGMKKSSTAIRRITAAATWATAPA